MVLTQYIWCRILKTTLMENTDYILFTAIFVAISLSVLVLTGYILDRFLQQLRTYHDIRLKRLHASSLVNAS